MIPILTQNKNKTRQKRPSTLKNKKHKTYSTHTSDGHAEPLELTLSTQEVNNPVKNGTFLPRYEG